MNYLELDVDKLILTQQEDGCSSLTVGDLPRKIMRANKVKHFYIRSTYMIPKACVIDYVLSEDYAKYSKTLKARV